MGLLFNNPLPSPSISTVEMTQAEFDALSVVPMPWGKWKQRDRSDDFCWTLHENVDGVDGHDVISWIVISPVRCCWWKPLTWFQ